MKLNKDTFLKNFTNSLVLIISIIIFGIIYIHWFDHEFIIGGDWPYFYNETIKEFSLIVPSWNAWQSNGLGGINQTYFLQIYQNFSHFPVNLLGVPWTVTYKFFWFGLFIILSILSSYFLSNIVLIKNKLWTRVIGILIFSTNTYVLMIADGGQMGYLLAYSITPLVVGCILNVINSENKRIRIKLSLLLSLALALQVIFDPRVAYISLIAGIVYFLLYSFFNNFNFLRFFWAFFIPLFLTCMFHMSWLLPYFLSRQSFSGNFGESYTGIGIVKFLSFAGLPQTISLLHPNWPENIFGKVSFMKGEFLILPALALLGLILSPLKKKNEFIMIMYFGLLFLIGAFFSKGSNFPLGESYIFLFSKVPGFVFFRDSSKFYILVIISTTILIPYSLQRIMDLRVNNLKNFVPILFILIWSFLILPGVFNGLSGTFKKKEIPQEYIKLKSFLYNQHDFFRTLWIPRQQRFSYYSNIHPSVEASPLFHETDPQKIVKILSSSSSQKKLQELGIEYVIVPYDSLGEIFMKDRKYDEKLYESLIKRLEKNVYLKRIYGYGKIAVFQTSKRKNHFYILDDTNSREPSYKMISPYLYQVNLNLNKSDKLIFSESFSPYWIAVENNKTYYSKNFNNFNSFDVDQGSHQLKIYFVLEDYYFYGRIISLISIISVIFTLIYLNKKNLLHKK